MLQRLHLLGFGIGSWAHPTNGHRVWCHIHHAKFTHLGKRKMPRDWREWKSKIGPCSFTKYLNCVMIEISKSFLSKSLWPNFQNGFKGRTVGNLHVKSSCLGYAIVLKPFQYTNPLTIISLFWCLPLFLPLFVLSIHISCHEFQGQSLIIPYIYFRIPTICINLCQFVYIYIY